MVKYEPTRFAIVWNNLEQYPTVADVADALGMTYKYVKNCATRHRKKSKAGSALHTKLLGRTEATVSTPIAHEQQYTQDYTKTPQQLLEALRALYFEDPQAHITRQYFRRKTGLADSVWNQHFGTFEEFKTQAGLEVSRHQRQFEKKIARHVAADHYRLYNERHSYADRYVRNESKQHKIIIGCSDLHDIEIDPFFLSTFIAACKMIQPDIINFGGDIFDLAEFGKYSIDPREWDVVGRIKWVHERIFKPVREACPNAQIDFIEGNHEYRLLKHLADATPALRAILSDLLGLTVSKLLGLDQFEINYIARADLAAYSGGQQKKEVGKSYKVYDEALLIHHHPHAKEWGLPGWNGHHHHWRVYREKSALRGAYNWMQLGCGHQLRASYCEGEFWDMGFVIAHLSPVSKNVNFEYVQVGDRAIVGGVVFERETV